MMVQKDRLDGSKHQLLFVFRIGSEKREIFGSQVKNSVAPGPGVYDLTKGLGFVKGKN